MAEDWTRVAAAVEARLAELRMGRTELAKKAKVDRKTVDNFLDRGMKPRTDKRGGYEAALAWGWGSMLDVARGGDPDVWSPDPQERLREAARRVAAGVAEGQEELAERNPRPEGEIDPSSVRDADDAAQYVATGAGGTAGMSDAEVLALIRESRRLADELERRITGDSNT